MPIWRQFGLPSGRQTAGKPRRGRNIFVTEIKTMAVDAVREALRRLLSRCDREGIGMSAAAPIDLAIHFVAREQDGLRHDG
jgi:hypothetical protein